MPWASPWRSAAHLVLAAFISHPYTDSAVAPQSIALLRLFCSALLLFPDLSPITYNHLHEHNRSFGAPAVPADVVFVVPFPASSNPFPALGSAIVLQPSERSGCAAVRHGRERKVHFGYARFASGQRWRSHPHGQLQLRCLAPG